MRACCNLGALQSGGGGAAVDSALRASFVGMLIPFLNVSDIVDSLGVFEIIRCDGKAYEITAYQELYSVLGDRYAETGGQAPPAAGFFRVPQLRGEYGSITGTGTSFGRLYSLGIFQSGENKIHPHFTVVDEDVNVGDALTATNSLSKEKDVGGQDEYTLAGNSAAPTPDISLTSEQGIENNVPAATPVNWVIISKVL